MAGTVRPVVDERDGLLAFLAHCRSVLRAAAFGLTEQQARATPTPSSLSVGGLIKHVTMVEEQWQNYTRQQPQDEDAGYEKYLAGFALLPSETLAGALEGYARAASRTDEMFASLDLEAPVPVPKDAPWFPQDVEAWSVRWVLLHLIQETARHAGHADIIREAIDGAGATALFAAAEGWPATPWVQPWQPPTS